MFFTPESVNVEALERILKLNASGRLAHAYLFNVAPGPGNGARETALAVAQGVNCLAPTGYKPGCACVSCHKIIDGNHPDIFVLEKPENKTGIVIAQMFPKPETEPFRPQHPPLITWLGVRALEARTRVVIILDADSFTPAAANAFLKTLEEPRPGTLFILTSAAPGALLPTVVSRCHEVRFAPALKSALVGKPKSGYDAAARDNTMIDEFILGVSSEALVKKWSEDRDKARELLGVVLTFYRDVFCAQQGAAEDSLHHPGRLSEIRRMSVTLTPGRIQEVIACAVKTVEVVNSNGNAKLALLLLKETIR
ncbi:MAG: hypothetical protein WCO69_04300 [Candidatus Omnitrophota bacterium]